jgi:hypothetical protein
MSMVWQYMFVFVAMTVADYLWSAYIIATTKLLPMQAALWSAGIALVNGAVVVVYVNKPILILIAGAGAFMGTFVSIKRAQKQTKSTEKEIDQ